MADLPKLQERRISRGIRALAAGAAIAFGFLLSAPRAEAGGSRPKLLIVAFGVGQGGEDELAARLAYHAEQSVDRIGRHELVDGWRAFDLDAVEASEAKIREGEKALAEARKAYDLLEVSEVAAKSDAAMEAFSQASLARSFPGFSRAWVLKIAALLTNGDAKGARTQMARLLAMDPAARLEPELFPPDVLAQAQAIRQQNAEAGGLPTEVRSVPPGARVYVDGVYRGFAPVELKSVSSGEHWVSVLAPGYSFYQSKFQSGESNVLARLKPASGSAPLFTFLKKAAKDPRGTGRDQAAKELGRAMSADQVLVLIAENRSGGSFKARAVRIAAKDGHSLCYIEDTLPTEDDRISAAAEAFLGRALRKDDPRLDGRAVVHAASFFSRWTQRHTGYVVMGAAGAMLAAGVAFGLAAENKSSAFHLVPQTDTTASAALKSSGKTYALFADISFLATLVTGGAGTFLALSSSDADPEGAEAGQTEEATEKTRPSADEEAPAMPAVIERQPVREKPAAPGREGKGKEDAGASRKRDPPKASRGEDEIEVPPARPETRKPNEDLGGEDLRDE